MAVQISNDEKLVILFKIKAVTKLYFFKKKKI